MPSPHSFCLVRLQGCYGQELTRTCSGVGLARDTYSDNDPVNKSDANGHATEQSGTPDPGGQDSLSGSDKQSLD